MRRRRGDAPSARSGSFFCLTSDLHRVLAEDAGQDRVADPRVLRGRSRAGARCRRPSGTGAAPGRRCWPGSSRAAVTRPPMLVAKPWAPASATWFSITSCDRLLDVAVLLGELLVGGLGGGGQRPDAVDGAAQRLRARSRGQPGRHPAARGAPSRLADRAADAHLLPLRRLPCRGAATVPSRRKRHAPWLGCGHAHRAAADRLGLPRPRTRRRPRRGDDLVGMGADLEPGHAARGLPAGLFPMPGRPGRGAGCSWWSPVDRGVLPLRRAAGLPVAAPGRAAGSRSASTPPSTTVRRRPAPTRRATGGWIDDADRARPTPGCTGSAGRTRSRPGRTASCRRAVRRRDRRALRGRVDVPPRARRLEGGAGRRWSTCSATSTPTGGCSTCSGCTAAPGVAGRDRACRARVRGVRQVGARACRCPAVWRAQTTCGGAPDSLTIGRPASTQSSMPAVEVHHVVALLAPGRRRPARSGRRPCRPRGSGRPGRSARRCRAARAGGCAARPRCGRGATRSARARRGRARPSGSGSGTPGSRRWGRRCMRPLVGAT